MIAMPRQVGRGLRNAMRLNDNWALFRSFTAHLRKLSSRFLNESTTFRYQTSEAIAALVAKIAETFPFLQSYQDAWPVKEYLKGYLRMSRFKLWQTKQATRMGDKAKENVASVIYANISHSHSLTAITAAFKANVTTIRHSDHFEQPKCLDTNERARLIDEMPLSPTKHYINEEIVSIVTASEGMVSSFTTFLRQTTPNLEHLQPRFAQAGVNDETSFRGLSTWPLPEMDAFLKDDMGLSLFEYQEVINALLFDYRKDAVV